MRRLPHSPSSSSSGANTFSQQRQRTFANLNSTVPTAVRKLRSRGRTPYRAKSAPAPHRGQANGAGKCRTGLHAGPQH
ncbi:MAG: hypothetical protein ACRDWI_12145 [Jiangellaceae bacterium]